MAEAKAMAVEMDRKAECERQVPGRLNESCCLTRQRKGKGEGVKVSPGITDVPSQEEREV